MGFSYGEFLYTAYQFLQWISYSTCLSISRLTINFTSSPNIIPPASKGELKVILKSFLAITPAISKPAFSTPEGEIVVHPNSAFRVRDFVIPFIVKSPTKVYSSSVTFVKEVE